MKLSKAQADVLAMMQQRGVVVPDGGAVTSTETMLEDRHNVFIHWRTAAALERLGLVTIHDRDGWSDDGYDVTLTEAGVAWKP